MLYSFHVCAHLTSDLLVVYSAEFVRAFQHLWCVVIEPLAERGGGGRESYMGSLVMDIGGTNLQATVLCVALVYCYEHRAHVWIEAAIVVPIPRKSHAYSCNLSGSGSFSFIWRLFPFIWRLCPLYLEEAVSILEVYILY